MGAFVCMCVCLCVCGLTFAVFEKLTNGCSVCNVSACLPGMRGNVSGQLSQKTAANHVFKAVKSFSLSKTLN